MSQNLPPSNRTRPRSGEERSRLVPDWREIAEQASNERDHRKLIRLVKALCDRLEELHAKKGNGRTSADREERDDSDFP